MSLEQRFSTATQVKRSGKSLTSEIEVNTNRISPECDQNPPSYQSKINPKDFFKLIRATTLSSAVVAVVSSLLISLDSELSEKDTTSVVCRVICIVLSVCQVLLVLRYHYYHMKVRMSEMSVVATSAWEGLWRHDKLFVLCEVMVNGVFVPPGVSGAVKYDQLGTYSYLSIGNLLTPCIYLRLYHCLRWGFYASQFSTPRTFYYMYIYVGNCTASPLPSFTSPSSPEELTAQSQFS